MWVMTAVAAKLDQKLAVWDTELAAEVERLVEEIINLADCHSLDILRSRQVEQDVLDILDENETR